MRILCAVFTDSDSKLTVMYEYEGTLESGMFPISRIEVEKHENIDLPTEIAGKKLAFTTTKTEIFNALRQTDIDYVEWKTVKMIGQVRKTSFLGTSTVSQSALGLGHDVANEICTPCLAR